MALSISAGKISSTNFSLTESNGNESITLSDSLSSTNSFTYGSGTMQITNAVSVTGAIPSGGFTRIDLYSIPQTTFNYTQNISFTGVKNFSIQNLATTEGSDFAITATGTNACTNLFNGGSGNLLVKPYSGFSYNDPHTGITVSASKRYLYLNDAGSGVNYKLFILGLD